MKEIQQPPCVTGECSFALTSEDVEDCTRIFDPNAGGVGVIKRNCALLRLAAGNFEQGLEDIDTTSEIAAHEKLD